MESIISKVLKKEPNFEFIGKEQQVLQVLLAPQQKIITRPSNVLYFSNNIKSTSQTSPPNNFTNFLSILGFSFLFLFFNICYKPPPPYQIFEGKIKYLPPYLPYPIYYLFFIATPPPYNFSIS